MKSRKTSIFWQIIPIIIFRFYKNLDFEAEEGQSAPKKGVNS